MHTLVSDHPARFNLRIKLLSRSIKKESIQRILIEIGAGCIRERIGIDSLGMASIS